MVSLFVRHCQAIRELPVQNGEFFLETRPGDSSDSCPFAFVRATRFSDYGDYGDVGDYGDLSLSHLLPYSEPDAPLSRNPPVLYGPCDLAGCVRCFSAD